MSMTNDPQNHIELVMTAIKSEEKIAACTLAFNPNQVGLFLRSIWLGGGGGRMPLLPMYLCY